MAKSALETQATALKAATSSLDAQKGMLELQSKIPSEHQSYIDMYSQMSDATGFKQRPNEPWRALLDGMFKGLALGEKSKMTKEMKERYEKLAKPAEWLSQWGDRLAKASEQEMKKAAVAEKVSGFVDPIYQARWNGADRTQIDEMGRLSLKALQEQGVVPPGTVYNTIDPDSMTAIYTKPDGSKGYLDLNQYISESARDSAKQTIDKIGADARMKSAKASQMRADTEAAYAPIQAASREAYAENIRNAWNPEMQYLKGFGAKQGQEEAKRVGALEDQNLHLEDKKWQVKELQDMLKGDKIITGQTIGAWLSRATGKQFNTEKMSETEAFDALSKNLLGFVKGDVKFGNMNQKEFEWLAKQTPDSTMTKGGIERILNRLESSIDRAIKRNETEMKRRPNYNPYDVKASEKLPEGGNASAGTQTFQNQQTPAQGANVGARWDMQAGVAMKNKEGEPVVVRKDKVREKMEQGYTYQK